MTGDLKSRQDSPALDVTAYICPVCLTVGAKDDRCGHYESGSVGVVYYSRRPATINVTPHGWAPILDSLDSPKVRDD